MTVPARHPRDTPLDRCLARWYPGADISVELSDVADEPVGPWADMGAGDREVVVRKLDAAEMEFASSDSDPWCFRRVVHTLVSGRRVMVTFATHRDGSAGALHITEVPADTDWVPFTERALRAWTGGQEVFSPMQASSGLGRLDDEEIEDVLHALEAAVEQPVDGGPHDGGWTTVAEAAGVRVTRTTAPLLAAAVELIIEPDE